MTPRTARKGYNKMKIEKFEKVILTETEFLILEKATDLLGSIYRTAMQEGEIEKETSNILALLSDFIDDNIEIEC